MPVYEYYCTRCDKAFTAEMHVADHEGVAPACPRCEKRDKVQKRMSSFTAVTTRKSTRF